MTKEQIKEFNSKFGRNIVDHSCIDKITKMDCSVLSKRERLHIDLFLLSYYTGGSTIRELANLTYSHIKDGYMYSRRCKGGGIAKVPYYECIADILDKYSDGCIDDYLLPIFTYKHITDEQQDGRIKRLSEQANLTLKKVALALGVKTDITMGSTHKIYIELMLSASVPFEKISEQVGCSYSTIIRYHEEMIAVRDELENEGLI